MNYPSRLLEDAVESFSALPGIGRKTALRLVLHLLRSEPERVNHFGQALMRLRNEAVFCKRCHNLSDQDVCSICSQASRDQSTICVVEDLRDVMAIETAGTYRGLYHVLGGIISPMDGIGPRDLQIDSLEARLSENNTRELILALRASMEGETTAFYLFRRLRDKVETVSSLARGLGVGDELEYADEVSLNRSFIQRTPFEATLSQR
jgi:recombination protein RecR